MDMAHKLEQGIAEREADVARREAALEKREAEATMERAALRQLKHHLTEAEGGLTDTRRQLAEAREELETANELKQAAQIQALQAKQRADTAVGLVLLLLVLRVGPLGTTFCAAVQRAGGTCCCSRTSLRVGRWYVKVCNTSDGVSERPLPRPPMQLEPYHARGRR